MNIIRSALMAATLSLALTASATREVVATFGTPPGGPTFTIELNGTVTSPVESFSVFSYGIRVWYNSSICSLTGTVGNNTSLGNPDVSWTVTQNPVPDATFPDTDVYKNVVFTPNLDAAFPGGLGILNFNSVGPGSVLIHIDNMPGDGIIDANTFEPVASPAINAPNYNVGAVPVTISGFEIE